MVMIVMNVLMGFRFWLPQKMHIFLVQTEQVIFSNADNPGRMSSLKSSQEWGGGGNLSMGGKLM